MARRVAVAGALIILTLGLAGCGGDSTPTVAPTPKELAVTTTPDVTFAPGSATVTPPPLATPQPRPSAGSDLTVTTSSQGTPPPANLTTIPSIVTPTLANSATLAPAPPGPTPTSDVRAVPIAQAAVKQMQGYKTYHFTAVTSDTAQTTNINGDYVAPDRLSVQTSLGGQSVQQIVIGSDVYINSGSGWSKSAVDASTLLTLARLWNTVVAVNGVTLVGEEQLGEEPVIHLRAVAAVADSGSLPGGTPGQAGQLMVDSWVDKGNNSVRRISLTTSVAGQTVYTVDASYTGFDEQVEVTPPPTGQ